MKKFEILLGDWDLEYNVPESSFSKKASGSGVGSIKRALNDKYVYFDYSATLTIGSGAAHAIFAWDEKYRIYRYWWFEDSGSFLTATCQFIGDDILFLNWHDTLLIQSFTKINRDKIVLKMEQPVAQDQFELILEVIFSRK